MENVHRRPNGCTVTSRTALRSKPVTRLERECYPAQVRVACLDKIFFEFPVFCRELCSRWSKFHPGEMHGTLEDDCCGLLQLGIPRGFLKEPLCPNSTGNPGAKVPQCQGAVLGGPGGAERARTRCSVQKIHLTSQTGCRSSAGMVPSLS